MAFTGLMPRYCKLSRPVPAAATSAFMAARRFFIHLCEPSLPAT